MDTLSQNIPQVILCETETEANTFADVLRQTE